MGQFLPWACLQSYQALGLGGQVPPIPSGSRPNSQALLPRLILFPSPGLLDPVGSHFHWQTQLKTCLRDKAKSICRLGCLVPSAGDPANSPWVREEREGPTGASNTWEQLAWLAPPSAPASPGGSATSSKPLSGESPKAKDSRSHQLPTAETHTQHARTRLCCIAQHHPGYPRLFAGRQPLLCI